MLFPERNTRVLPPFILTSVVARIHLSLHLSDLSLPITQNVNSKLHTECVPGNEDVLLYFYVHTT